MTGTGTGAGHGTRTRSVTVFGTGNGIETCHINGPGTETIKFGITNEFVNVNINDLRIVISGLNWN